MQRLVLITGAAKGIGAAIAFELNKCKTKTNFFLLDKNESNLSETKKTLIKCSNGLNQANCVNIDFSNEYDVNDYIDLLKQNLPIESELKKYEEALFFYNHGINCTQIHCGA